MKLENQVCSLELSQKLKELGVKQESLFWWLDRGGGFQIQYVEDLTDCAYDDEKNGSRFDWAMNYMKKFGENNYLSAFTVAELGEMLPENENIVFMRFPNNHFQNVMQDDKKWGKYSGYAEGNTEADARAKLMVYLLENKLINP